MAPDGKDNQKPRGELTPAQREEFKKRSADLGGKLEGIKDAKAAHRHETAGNSSRGMAYGLRMASELVASIVVGGLAGYGLDHWLGTRPWLFLLLFTAGFVAGVMSVLRAYKRLQDEMTAKAGGNIGKALPDDDD